MTCVGYLGAACCVALWACERPADPAPVPADAAAVASARASSSPPSRGTLAAARERMERLIAPGADRKALLADLAPRPGDAAAAFVDGFAEKAEPFYATHFEELELAPTPEQTELLMWRVSSEELRAGTADAKKCPAAYRPVAASLEPGLTWYCFRFVKPAEKTGTESEGLVFVNGRWVLFPAPWRIE